MQRKSLPVHPRTRGWLAVVLFGLAACNPTLIQVRDQPTSEDPSGETDVASEPQGNTAPCNLDEEVAAESYVRRVKNLLTGLAPTDGELQAVQQDPDALRDLVAGWQQTPGYQRKLAEFFRKSLQQQGVDDNLGRQLHGGENNDDIPDELEDALYESFVRTAVRIAQNDEPFTDVTETRTWELNTALMSWFLAVDKNPNVDDYQFYTGTVTVDGQTFDANTPLGQQFAARTFHVASLNAGCNEPYAFRDSDNLRGQALLNRTVRTFLGDNAGNDFCNLDIGLFGPEDYADWRPVTMVPLGDDQPVEFFDVTTLRRSNELALRLPRTGFFTSPAFLAMWETNDDNSFRVITNQTLIAALGIQFESEDSTTPLGDEGLAEEHAAPGTACYGCHKNLDPMRNYFRNDLTSPFYSVVDPDDVDDDYVYENASFSFQGYSGGTAGEALADLGSHLASHPRFAPGWVQKLCFYANSGRCDEDDPEFTRIVDAFSASGYRFSTLVTELFSSPLVTRSSCAEGYERQFPAASVSRRDHLCTTLSERLGRDDVCTTNRSRARDLANSLPEDVWPRGRETPEQPTEPALVYTATVDALCRAIANNVVDVTDSPLQSTEMATSLEVLVSDVMGLPPSDPLHDPVLARLQLAESEADESGIGRRDRLRTAFTIACSSPFVSTVDL